jgi:hypothetical protein
MYGTNRRDEHHMGVPGKPIVMRASHPASGRFEPVSSSEFFSNISTSVNRDPFLPGVTGMVAENKPNTQPEEKW